MLLLSHHFPLRSSQAGAALACGPPPRRGSRARRWSQLRRGELGAVQDAALFSRLARDGACVGGLRAPPKAYVRAARSTRDLIVEMGRRQRTRFLRAPARAKHAHPLFHHPSLRFAVARSGDVTGASRRSARLLNETNQHSSSTTKGRGGRAGSVAACQRGPQTMSPSPRRPGLAAVRCAVRCAVRRHSIGAAPAAAARPWSLRAWPCPCRPRPWRGPSRGPL
jgi:hypothetical protein